MSRTEAEPATHARPARKSGVLSNTALDGFAHEGGARAVGLPQANQDEPRPGVTNSYLRGRPELQSGRLREECRRIVPARADVPIETKPRRVEPGPPHEKDGNNASAGFDKDVLRVVSAGDEAAKAASRRIPIAQTGRSVRALRRESVRRLFRLPGSNTEEAERDNQEHSGTGRSRRTQFGADHAGGQPG